MSRKDDACTILARARTYLLGQGTGADPIDEDEIAAAYEALDLLDSDRLGLCWGWVLQVSRVVAELDELQRKIPAEVWHRMMVMRADLPERRKRLRIEDRLRKLWQDRPALLRRSEIYVPQEESD